MTTTLYRTAAALALALWVAALFAPDNGGIPGWGLALSGWLGPLGLFVVNQRRRLAKQGKFLRTVICLTDQSGVEHPLRVRLWPMPSVPPRAPAVHEKPSER